MFKAMSPVPEPVHPDARPHAYSRRKRPWLKRTLDEWAARRFFTRLVKNTNNFSNVEWLGHPVWQNVLDLCTIQQTIAEVRPDAIIETGTNRGGSSLFFAHLFDLMASADSLHQGRVLTIDIEKLHDIRHPRVTCLIGSSLEEGVIAQVTAWLRETVAPAVKAGRDPRVLVILDSDHSKEHVARELEVYCRFVTHGSFLLCQDGVLDTLPLFRSDRAGPLPAIREFLSAHAEFEVDHARCEQFIITHHPLGWLRRKPGGPPVVTG